LTAKKRGRGSTVARGARYSELISTALDMFAERGYEHTSIEDIADRLGILKGSLYHYITSKEDLLVNIMSDGMARLQPVIDDIHALEEPPEAKLRIFLERYTVHAIEQRWMNRIFASDFRSLDRKNQRDIVAQRDEYDRFLTALIEDAQADGSVRPDIDARVTASAVFGMINSTYQWYKPSGPKTAAQLAELFRSILLDGLLVGEQPVGSATSGADGVSTAKSKNAR
jgi:TetR/AcrR family transcriptional regulator, cholesterol catabolism regulator